MIIMEVIGPIQDVSTEKFSDLDPPDDYLYHVTSDVRARSILTRGFKLWATGKMVANYQEYSKNKIFFVERNGVSRWLEIIENHLFHNFDDPPNTTVLRVPKAALAGRLVKDEVGTRDSRADCYYITTDFP